MNFFVVSCNVPALKMTTTLSIVSFTPGVGQSQTTGASRLNEKERCYGKSQH